MAWSTIGHSQPSATVQPARHDLHRRSEHGLLDYVSMQCRKICAQRWNIMHCVRGWLHHQHWHCNRGDDLHGLRRGHLLDGEQRGGVHCLSRRRVRHGRVLDVLVHGTVSGQLLLDGRRHRRDVSDVPRVHVRGV